MWNSLPANFATSSSQSSLLLNETQSSVNLNNSLYNETNRNANSLLQASQTIKNTAQQVPSHSSLLMTSQYSDKTNNTIVKSPSSTTAMRLNSNSPYQQPLTQQQLHQQPQPPPAQRHHQQQTQQNQQQQQLLHNALQQPTSHHTTQTITTNPNASHLQGVFNNGNQQVKCWFTLDLKKLHKSLSSISVSLLNLKFICLNIPIIFYSKSFFSFLFC